LKQRVLVELGAEDLLGQLILAAVLDINVELVHLQTLQILIGLAKDV